jgi:hypothetical protein
MERRKVSVGRRKASVGRRKASVGRRKASVGRQPHELVKNNGSFLAINMDYIRLLAPRRRPRFCDNYT